MTDDEEKKLLKDLGLEGVPVAHSFDEVGDMIYQLSNSGLDPKRPYDGQPWTDQGERGRVFVNGLTFRDIMDCFVIGWLEASGRSGLLETGDASYNDMYGHDDSNIDPLAVAQEMTCAIEKRMGLWPNWPLKHSGRVLVNTCPKHNTAPVCQGHDGTWRCARCGGKVAVESMPV